MSKLLKSKFLLGALVVTVMVVGVAVSASPASADCSITHTLRVGSKGAEVVCLQTALGGLTADGSFGPKTKAAVIAWQVKSGLVADGIFGPKSNAVWVANQVNVGVFPAGCTSAVGFSTTTGLSCSGAVVVGNLPAGCTSTSGFSPTTGMSCSVLSNLPAGCSSTAGYSPTTGVKCDSTGVVAPSGTNGYLADLSLDSTGRVSTVYESEQDKVVAGFRATARLATQTVDRVRVTFCNDTTPGGVCSNTGASSSNLAKYISSASLWYGSTKLATMTVAQADRGTSNDVYTFNFSGLSAAIPKDAIGRFYVSVTANGSLDSADVAAANWTVKFLAAGVSASSPDGSSDTYPGADIEQTGLLFGKFSSNGVKATIGLSSTNPSSSIVAVATTSPTNNVTLLKFTVKATNSSLTLRKVPIQVTLTGTTADDVTNVINTVKLYRGANLVDSVDGSSGLRFVAGAASSTGAAACVDSVNAVDDFCTFFFSNLSNPDNMVASGDTAEYSVVVDLKQSNTNYAEGDTLTASLVNADVALAANFSVLDTNGDQLPATTAVRVGSAIGNIQTLRVNGVQVVMGTPSFTTVTDAGQITQVTYVIPLTATAFGQTLYVGQSAENAAAASGATTTAKALSYTVIGSDGSINNDGNCGVAGGTASVCSATFETSDALTEGNGFRLDSGTAKHFTLKVTLITPEVNNISYRVRLNDIRTDIESTLENTTSPLVNNALLPVESYQTGFQLINN